MTRFAESDVEEATLGWLEGLGYQVLYGAAIAPGEPAAERTDYDQVVLSSRLRQALDRLNPRLPPSALDTALRHLLHPEGPTLEARNRSFHRMLVDGVNVEYTRRDGTIAGAQARVLDFDQPEDNDWLAVNQFSVLENKHTRRPDVVLFVNGLPLAVIELKNPADELATVETAFRQLQTYKAEIPSLFLHNEALVVSDGVSARLGTLTGAWEWFLPWRTIEGAAVADAKRTQLEVLLKGVFDHGRFLDLIRSFVVFEDSGDGRLAKKMAGYHQYHAVKVAVEETLRALALRDVSDTQEGYRTGHQHGGERGDRRIGVVWHTQGAGKSLTMAFYAGKLIAHPGLANPTLVVLTDRIDLDGQLFSTFSRCQDLLRQPPTQAESRADLRQKLRVNAGGVVFTTIQKFLPEDKGDTATAPLRFAAGAAEPVLSDRRNIVVIADEAHRSQYDFIDGYAARMHDALPNASFIGFTGTPIELADRNTRAVFGDYISVYDIQRAVLDGATVPIYYESRLAKLELLESERPRLDPNFDEVTEGEEVERKERLKTRWAQLEALVGADRRVALIAQDLVAHLEDREKGLRGKVMIVCMSRRICIDLYDALVALRPQWHGDTDEEGRLKIVMTGSASDPLDWQEHIRNKERRERLADRFRDPADPFSIVIVRDMWLTGFDAPSLHTMYVDKPMRGHGLMQAIARVNRVFRDKPGGLVVDYLGLADELRQAMSVYTESGGTGTTAIDQQVAVGALKERYDVCRGLFHGLDWTAWTKGTADQRLGLLPVAQEHILALENGKTRLIETVSELSRAFALAVPHPDALALRDDIGFFQAVRSVLAKESREGVKESDLDHAVAQLVSRAIATDGVIDLFAATGLKRPDISVLSDEFLAELKGLPQKNLAVEMLRKLLAGEIQTRLRRNVVQARSFAQMLETAIKRYQNRAIETAQVIEELIALARQMREESARGVKLGLSEDELAFYDALETNDSAVKVLGEPTLKAIARELVQKVRGNVTIDWTIRENVRARLRVMVKRILRQHGYPPDKQEKATQTVLEQAEVLSAGWAEE